MLRSVGDREISPRGSAGSFVNAETGNSSSLRCVSGTGDTRIEDQLRRVVGDLRLPPRFNLALQRLEVPLNPVHADRERINQLEALGVFGQDRREIARDNVSKFCIT